MTDTKQIVIPCRLFPFVETQIFDYEYKKFQLLNVFRTITTEQRELCTEMWLQSGVLSSKGQAWERSKQVCYLFIERATGRLVGVNTLYEEVDAKTNKKWFLNRMFILPEFRNTRLMIIGTSLMLCFAKTHLAQEGVQGVVNINENIKLHSRGLHKIFTGLGYQFSHVSDDKEVWFFAFDRIEFLN